MPLKILFAGAGEFGLPTLRAILDAGHEVPLVISQPDKPAGRGNRLTPTPVAKFAIERGLPLLRTADVNAEQLSAADLMVVIAFGQKIAPHVVDHPRLSSVNLHASILPKLRGAAPINWAILRGDTHAGNSIIRLAQKMDAGPVLAQSSFKIGHLETAGELHDRLAEDGGPLMLRVIEQLATGKARETPQDESQATVAPKLTRDHTKLDFARHAHDLGLQIRGLYPWPGCRVRLIDRDGKERDRLTLVRAQALPAHPDHPGDPDAAFAASLDAGDAQLESFKKCTGLFGIVMGGLTIATGDAALELVEVQPEGKRPMPLSAYRNGHPFEAGMRLESL
jgi:methionyl-tRNA formyltransferase